MNNLSDFWLLTWIYFWTESPKGPLLLHRTLETIPSFTPCSNAPVLCVCTWCACVCVPVSSISSYPGPYLKPLVSGSMAFPCTQHPAASPSPASLCHSSGSSPSPPEHFHSLGSHSAASTEAEDRGQRPQVTIRPRGQCRLGALTIDVGKHDPATIFDLQTNTSYMSLESIFNCGTVHTELFIIVISSESEVLLISRLSYL